MILFCLDNFKDTPFFGVLGFDFLPFFAINRSILGVKIQIYNLSQSKDCFLKYFWKIDD